MSVINYKNLESAENKKSKKKRVAFEKGSLSFDEKKSILGGIGILGDVDFQALPVGIDKIYAEVALSPNCVNHQMELTGGAWKREKHKRTGESNYRYIVHDKRENQLFYFKLYRGVRHNPLTDKKAETWILLVEFNPSYWMYRTGHREAVQGENYVAGNATALELAWGELEALLRSPALNQLETVERAPLTVLALRITQVHLTRDFRLHPIHLKFRLKYGWYPASRAFWEKQQAIEVLALLMNAYPRNCARYDPAKSKEFTVLEGEIKDATNKKSKYPIDPSRTRELKALKKMMSDGRNPLGSPFNYVSRGILTRHDVFYIKDRYDKHRRKDNQKSFRGSAPRFELKLLTSDGLKILGVNDFVGLHGLMVEVDLWHQKGRVTEPPLLEKLLNDRLQAFNYPSAKSLKKSRQTYVPVLTKDFIDFLLMVETAVYQAQDKAGVACSHAAFVAHLKKIQAFRCGQPLDFAEQELVLFSLNIALTVLKPITLYQMAGRVTGYLDAKNLPTHAESARAPYSRLVDLVNYFLDYYGGDFLGVSKFDQRQILMEKLAVTAL